jgi:hypothetical protein
MLALRDRPSSSCGAIADRDVGSEGDAVTPHSPSAAHQRQGFDGDVPLLGFADAQYPLTGVRNVSPKSLCEAVIAVLNALDAASRPRLRPVGRSWPWSPTPV